MGLAPYQRKNLIKHISTENICIGFSLSTANKLTTLQHTSLITNKIPMHIFSHLAHTTGCEFDDGSRSPSPQRIMAYGRHPRASEDHLAWWQTNRMAASYFIQVETIAQTQEWINKVRFKRFLLFKGQSPNCGYF